MGQYYKLKDFKVGDYKDPNGNTWCNAVFEGHGEPVRWVVKEPEKIVLGSNYYGHMEDKMSQADKPYVRFYREKEPETSSTATQSPSNSSIPTVDWDAKNKDIRAQMAVKTAAVLYANNKEWNLDDLEHTARELYTMVDRVKLGTPGYDKAKAVAEDLKPDTDYDPGEDPGNYDI